MTQGRQRQQLTVEDFTVFKKKWQKLVKVQNERRGRVTIRLYAEFVNSWKADKYGDIDVRLQTMFENFL